VQARERSTLTNRLLVLAALIVVSTTVLLVGTSAGGVYRMAVRQESARHAAYGDVVVSRLGSRFANIRATMRSAAENPALRHEDESVVQQALSSLALSEAAYIEGAVLLAEPTATPVAWPAGSLDEASLHALRSVDASSAADSVLWVPPAGSERGALWAYAPVRTPGERTRLLAARVRTSFIDGELAEVGNLPGSPLALVIDEEGDPLFASMPLSSLEGREVEVTPGADTSSTGAASIETSIPLAGTCSPITEPADLGWSVAVLEPKMRVWGETWTALRPGLVGWAVALVVALVGALVVINSSTRPLRQLERRARAIGAGERVEPEEVMAHDEVGRLLDAFNGVVRRFNRLTDAAELLARTNDRRQVIVGVATSVAHMFDPADVDVLLFGDYGDLELAVARGGLSGRHDVRIPVPEEGWIAECLQAGQPVAAVFDPDDPVFALHGRTATVGMAAPLWAGGDCIGAIAVIRHEGRAFTAGEKETLRSFIAQAAVALQNSRLFENERRSRREAEALREIAERVSSPVGVDETLRYVAASEAELLGFDGSDVVLLDPSSDYGLDDPGGGDGSAWVQVWHAVDRDRSCTEPVYVGDSTRDPDVKAALDSAGVRAALLTPLMREGRCVALLVCTSADESRPPGSERMGLARTIGAEASLALENAYLFQAAKSRADNLETIFRISHAVGSSLQTRVVLNRVLDVVQKILSADAVMLMTYDSARKMISIPMARGILHRDMLEITFRPGEDVPGRVFETREPERYDRISEADTRLLNAASRQGLESLLAVPLLARGRSIGVLVVFAKEPGMFSNEEMDLLRTFAAQAALAIDTAELFSKEHHVASVLQASILPSGLPRVPGLDTSSVYQPAGTDADIGGDYYDLFVAPDGTVSISIGDVCGKGVVAATKTSMIKYAIRGMVAADLAPSRILEELNRMLLESGDATSIVTLWLGRLDTSTGVLRYADGGHPAGLLRHGDPVGIDRLGTTGALLGAVADGVWEEQEARLSHGSTLLLYTDGVTEARDQTRFFGEGRVHRALRPGGTASEVAQRLLTMVQRFSEGEMRDDAAILVVRYEPESGEGVTDGSDSGM